MSCAHFMGYVHLRFPVTSVGSAALTRWPARSLSRHKLTTASQCVRLCSGRSTLTFASCWVFRSPLAYDSSRRASAPSGALQLFWQRIHGQGCVRKVPGRAQARRKTQRRDRGCLPRVRPMGHCRRGEPDRRRPCRRYRPGVFPARLRPIRARQPVREVRDQVAGEADLSVACRLSEIARVTAIQCNAGEIR